MLYTELKYCTTPRPLGDGSTNTGILCKINGLKSAVPMHNKNRNYIEIMKQVNAGTITIADAD